MTPKTVQSTRARPGALTQAGAIREARAIRIRAIRRRVLAGALSLFVATWLLITLMLVSGHDPVLAARVSSTKTATGSANTATGSSNTATGSTQATTRSSGNSAAPTTTIAASGSTAASASGSTAASASGVTTRQS
jgi:hypothetical protein